MQPLLAILERRTGATVLREGGGTLSSTRDFEDGPLAFSDTDHVAAYFAFWLHDRGAMVRLRRALHEIGHSRVVGRCSDVEVIRALAGQVASGAVEVFSVEEEHSFLNVRAAFSQAAAASAKPTLRPAGATVVMPAMPAVAEPPLLPLLEQVQIEGAEVLPEVLQTLEQIDISLGTLNTAALSLEPTPSAIPGISGAMSEASASVTAALDTL